MLSRAFARVAQRAVLWCLLVAAPMYGVSSAVAQVIGPQHTRRAAIHIDEPFVGWQDMRRAIGHDVSGAPLHRAAVEEPCQGPGPDTVTVLDARVLDSLDDDSPDATSGFGLAMTPAAPIEPPQTSTSPPRHSHAIAVLTYDGSRLDRPPKA